MSPKKSSRPVPPSASVQDGDVSQIMKWLPFIVAGGALGVSAYMFVEMQKLKKQKVSSSQVPPETQKQIQAMDEQLRKVSTFLSHQFPSQPATPTKKTGPPSKDVTSSEDEEEEIEIETEEVIVETDEEESIEEGGEDN